MDTAKLAEDIQSPATKAIIEADLAEVGRFQFEGVPVFLVNGTPLYGVPTQEEFFRLVDAKLAAAK